LHVLDFFCEKCQLLLGTGLVLPGAAAVVFDLVQCNTLVVENDESMGFKLLVFHGMDSLQR
jgi:hypothetical protein